MPEPEVLSAMAARVYKICRSAEWREAEVQGVLAGTADDRRDGYVHLSTAAQVAGVLRRHFAGGENLLLIAFDADQLGPALRWERNGADIFPHLYAALPTVGALEVCDLPADEGGRAALVQSLK